jgi:prepilin-type N-terminal cleavage/methylation domain-containing protein
MGRNIFGLTLLEMIVTIVVVAIAATLAVAQLQKGIEQKKTDSAIEALRSISYCIRFHRLESGGTIPPGTKFRALEMEIDGNKCMDREQFPKDFNFPSKDAIIPADPIMLEASMNTPNATRKVCLAPAGEVGRTGIIYDFLSGACNASRTDYARRMNE